MATTWQNVAITLTNGSSVSTTFTGGNNDLASITNYVQLNANKGFWVGQTYYPSPFLAIAIS